MAIGSSITGDGEADRPDEDTEAASADKSEKNLGIEPDVDCESETFESRKSTKTRPAKAERAPAQISMSIRTLMLIIFSTALVAGMAFLGWSYYQARRELNEIAQQNADNAHAEKVAVEYAVRAAQMDYKDISGWRSKLVDGTTPELANKLQDAATTVEQVLVPLQWSSTATPIIAKVRTVDNGTYVVDAFVGIVTKTTQAPKGLPSTATYSVTIDSRNDWKITEVGGANGISGEK